MPMHIDILENEVLGLLFQKGLQEERQERPSRRRTDRFRQLIEKCFGALPSWAGDKLAALPASELEDLSLRVLDAKSVEELLT
jgi:hypothetical protein